MTPLAGFKTPVTRHYVDIRSYIPDGPFAQQTKDLKLPLIETLPDSIQESIGRYVRASDRFMSLASALLKYQFIHQNAKIPWSQIRISRTPKPHGRPYWDPPRNWHGENFKGLEFNVSHQAGLVVLFGCRTPHRPPPANPSDSQADNEDDDHYIDPNPDPQRQEVRLGVDVACTQEPRRTPDLSTQAKLDAWVDTFAEMFSDGEREDMKNDPHPAMSGVYGARIKWNWQGSKMNEKARRFYACWALKEAYIKMVGEGLLAYWLRDLEFANVIPPQQGQRFRVEEAGIQVLFEGTDITESINTVLEGLGSDFILATMMRGVEEETSKAGLDWIKVDIEADIRPCAEGLCACLD